MKIDTVVRQETIYIACVTLILSGLMEAVFLILGMWDYTVLLGNLLGAAAGIGNFFLMGLGVQKAVMQEEKDARQTMRVSQTGRTFMLFVILVIGVVVPVFHSIAAVVPVIFPRIAVALRPMIKKKEGENS